MVITQQVFASFCNVRHGGNGCVFSNISHGRGALFVYCLNVSLPSLSSRLRACLVRADASGAVVRHRSPFTFSQKDIIYAGHIRPLDTPLATAASTSLPKGTTLSIYHYAVHMHMHAYYLPPPPLPSPHSYYFAMNGLPSVSGSCGALGEGAAMFPVKGFAKGFPVGSGAGAAAEVLAKGFPPPPPPALLRVGLLLGELLLLAAPSPMLPLADVPNGLVSCPVIWLTAAAAMAGAAAFAAASTAPPTNLSQEFPPSSMAIGPAAPASAFNMSISMHVSKPNKTTK